MLHSISWGRFGSSLFLVLALYYGYVVLRFYRRELWALVSGRKVRGISKQETASAGGKVASGQAIGSRGDVVGGETSGASLGVADGLDGGRDMSGEAKGVVSVDGKGGGAAGGQARLFPESAVNETPELFKVMEKLIIMLRQIVSEAAATGARREELEDRIRMALSGYRHLAGTPYQVSVNNFIQRTCTTTFSLLLSDEEIAALWES